MEELIKIKLNSLKSYILSTGLGILAGIITRLSDFFPNDNLWNFSSIATLFGFWIFTTTLVIYFSSSNKNAAINVILYLFSMNFSFYFLLYLLGYFIPRFYTEGFQWNLFMLYNIVVLVGGIIAYILHFWNKPNKLNSLLYALPVSGLVAETIGVGIYFYKNDTFLFQLIFDFLSLIILGGWFYKKVNNKLTYVLSIGIVSLSGYFLIYRPFL
ncbi:magnesium-transporting ATPase (P-type) [Fictibacillus barbaricus]|uniref:Magnesium-transporting ATPase (P-type) n=1 Tax=Fictibacillus barbaricus TaxID=182136 RepID=A0ABU1U246_9BACL|nr:magnesium-transporting ATPase (P-type) [Fictibacillus barbaricus]